MTVAELIQKLEQVEVIVKELRHQLTELQDPDSILSKQIDKVTSVVEHQLHLTKDQVYEDTRRRSTLDGRMMTVTILRHVLGLRLSKIGFLFKRDPSSIKHSIKQLKILYGTDFKIHDDFKIICQRLAIGKELFIKMTTKTT